MKKERYQKIKNINKIASSELDILRIFSLQVELKAEITMVIIGSP